jgi:hypothetical protein
VDGPSAARRHESQRPPAARQRDEDTWGGEPFRIGLWVGTDRWPEWTAATKDQGEGIFLPLDETAVAGWESRVLGSDLWEAHRQAHRRNFDGRQVRNHAKFLAIDHRFLLVSSANFSWSAEYGNVELGVLIDNQNLTESVERAMRDIEDRLFERVWPRKASW